jgi:hypothetical protein
VPTRKLLWPSAFCVTLALALPATVSAKPTARYLLRPSSPLAGQATTFDASRTSCDFRPCTYRWSRVLRSSSRRRRLRPLGRGKVIRHTFRRPGVRYLRLTVRSRRGQKSSTTRRIVVSNAPPPPPTPAPPPAAAVSLEQVDGGPGWYGKFANPLPTDPSFFPIGVWGSYNQTQANLDLDADVGLNLYVWAADSAFLPAIRQDGRFHAIQDHRNRANVGTETAGWLLADEIDMTEGPSACNGSLQAIKNGLPADVRARYSNYGKGVLLWETDAEAACFVEAQQLVSSDLYWFTDPNQIDMIGRPWLPEGERQMTLNQVRRAANYGYQVDRMRALDARDGQRKPIWNFVEVGWPFIESAAQGARAITAPEIRAAVWHSIIAGARGIIYFNHSFGGPCTSHHVLRDSCGVAVRPTVKAVGALIKQLAPVLNAPFAHNLVSANGVRTMAKWQGGQFYVFAGSKENQATNATFDIPCVGNARATVIDEGRSIPITNGQFRDQFADGNSIHIYRIDGGSTCGLPAETAQPAPGPGGRTRHGEQPKRKTARVGRLPRRISLRSARLVVPVTCVARCSVRSRLTMRGASRRIMLASRHRRFLAGRHKLALRLSKRARRRIARARSVRLRTVIVEPRGGGARRTQRFVAKRR